MDLQVGSNFQGTDHLNLIQIPPDNQKKEREREIIPKLVLQGDMLEENERWTKGEKSLLSWNLHSRVGVGGAHNKWVTHAVC